MTLTEFTLDFYFGIVLKLATSQDVQRSRQAQVYETALHYWCEITGDPPLAEIDERRLADFEVQLQLRTVGHAPIGKSRELSHATVAKLLRSVRVLLRHARASA